MKTIFIILLAALAALTDAVYTIPEAKFEILHPRGFRASIPHEDGVKLFAFHANLNRPMTDFDMGQVYGDVTNRTNGKWVFQDKRLKIREGDVLYYWIFVLKNGIGYRQELKRHVFKKNVKSKRLTKRRAWFGRFEGGWNHGPHFGPMDHPYNWGYHHHLNCHKNHHHHHHHGHDFGSDEEFNDGSDYGDYDEVVSYKTTQKPTPKPTRKFTSTSTTQKSTTTVETTTTIPNFDIRFGE